MAARHAVTSSVAALLLAPLVAAAQMTPADIAKKAIPAVVFIKGLTIDGKEATGSGFIVDPSGVIVTNLHVVQGLKTAAVKLANGDVYDQVNIKAFDERKDLAVIQIQGFSLPCRLSKWETPTSFNPAFRSRSSAIRWGSRDRYLPES